MLKKLYDWLLRLSHKGYAQTVLFGVAFLESSCFPIPPDAFLIPFCLANRERTFRFATLATVGSVLGGVLGYAIGFYFADTIGHWILKLYGSESALDDYQKWFARWGIYVILIKGLTPIPYKLVTIASGVAHFDLFTFIWSSIVTRGFRFFPAQRPLLEIRARRNAAYRKEPDPHHGRRSDRGHRRHSCGTLPEMKLAYTIRSTVLTLGALSFLALAFAIVSQKLFGYAPCELCMIQRYWHGAVVVAAALMLVLGRPRLFVTLQTIALLICCGYSLYHAGVEQHWWEGSALCVGHIGGGTVEDLREQILSAPVVRCDEIRWTLFGLSMAVYDAMLTGAMALFAIVTGIRKR